MHSSRSATTQPGFPQFWAGEGLSQFGAQFTNLAMPVIAVNLLHATDSQMGYLNASTTIAFLVIGLLAGGLVDRWRKRRVMIASDLFRAAAILAVPLMFWLGRPEIWHLYIIAGLIGFATVFFDVAYMSYIPVLVKDTMIGDANSKLEATAQVARLAGPGLAGILLRIVNAPVLLVVNAAGFLASAAFLSTIGDTVAPTPRSERGPLLDEIREGISFVWNTQFLRRMVMTLAISNFGSTMVFTLLPIIVLRILGISPWWYGIISSIGAVGGVIGSLFAVRFARRFGQGPTLVGTVIVSGLTMSLLPLTLLAPSSWAIPLLMATWFVMSFAAIMWNVIQVTARQRLCPRPLLGRMNASIRFVVWGIMPISALAAGWLGTVIGTVGAVWVGVAIASLSVLPILLSPYARMREFPVRPSESSRQPV